MDSIQKRLKNLYLFKKIQKSMAYARFRQFFPMDELKIVDDRDLLEDATIINIDWPNRLPKPMFGLIQDHGNFPRWTKYRRFLENNDLPYEIYDLNADDWLIKAEDFDIIVGVRSNIHYELDEFRKKIHILENYLHKFCYPSFQHSFLYEDKSLEAFLAEILKIPFANTYVSYNKKSSLQFARKLKYPVIHKLPGSSGSIGVELVPSLNKAKRIINNAFSKYGRQTSLLYERQKNIVYFQEFIPGDGYDLRVIVVGNWGFGYYRKNLKNDFRASGMNQVERRDIPKESLNIAWDINKILKSPILVVDMVKDNDGQYHVIEFSPICEVNTSVQLAVNDEPGVYILQDDGNIFFQKGRFWLHELGLRQFLLDDYLPKFHPIASNKFT